MRCKGKKKDGTPCQASAHPGKRYCCFHNPDLAEQRAEGRRKGGINRREPTTTLPPDTPDLPLKSVADVVAALAQTINQVRTGRIDARVGNCLFVGAGVLLKAIQESDIEARLAALESRNQNQRRLR